MFSPTVARQVASWVSACPVSLPLRGFFAGGTARVGAVISAVSPLRLATFHSPPAYFWPGGARRSFADCSAPGAEQGFHRQVGRARLVPFPLRAAARRLL